MTRFLIQDYKLGIDQAIDFIYNSDTYQKLVNPQTELYVQSPAYIYQLVENEYKTGKLELINYSSFPRFLPHFQLFVNLLKMF